MTGESRSPALTLASAGAVKPALAIVVCQLFNQLFQPPIMPKVV